MSRNEDINKKIERLEYYRDMARTKLEAKGKSMSQVQLNSILEQVKHLNREIRKLKSEQDVLYFTYEYFSEDRNPDNENNLIPKGQSILTAPAFHRELCDMLNTVAWEETTKNVGWSCPRGHAKSTYLSNVFPLYSIVFNLRHYIVIVSETGGMAERFAEWISDQLKYNQKLREDFGELLSPKKVLND